MNDRQLSVIMQRAFYATFGVVAAVGLVYMGYLAREPLLWIAIAAFLAVALNPLVHGVQRFMPKKSLLLATIVVLVIFCGVLGVLAWLFLAPLLQQIGNIVANPPEFITKINESLSKTPLANMISINKQAVASQLQASNDANQVVQSKVGLGAALVPVLSGFVDILVAIVSIVSLMFFMTIEGQRMSHFVQRLIPANRQKQMVSLGRDVYDIINGYVVGNFIISGIYGLISGLVLWLCGSPYFLVLAVLVGLIDLIPLVGATIAAVLVGLISILTGQPLIALIFGVYTIVYVQFESSVLNPAIYSKNVDVSPLTVLVSILIGAAVAGVMGALIAIPIAATMRVVINSVLANRAKQLKS